MGRRFDLKNRRIWLKIKCLVKNRRFDLKNRRIWLKIKGLIKNGLKSKVESKVEDLAYLKSKFYLFAAKEKIPSNLFY